MRKLDLTIAVIALMAIGTSAVIRMPAMLAAAALQTDLNSSEGLCRREDWGALPIMKIVDPVEPTALAGRCTAEGEHCRDGHVP
jgi:hypothetical protein